MNSILVVDDAEDVRRVVTKLLSPDYEVRQAADGEEALRAIRRSQPDLVLLDIDMPEMDGLEALRRITEMSPGLPVYMVTGDLHLHAVDYALSSGARGYVLKPFRTERLLGAVREAFSGR